MKRLIYEDIEGVHIVIPSPEWKGTMEDLAAKDVPKGKPYEIVEDVVIPKDRTFRGAWIKSLGKVEVDMPKARVIHMDRIREARDKEIEKTDKEVVRASEVGVVPKALKDKRQALRDIPQTFDLSIATTPEELKARWPVELPVQ